MYSRSVLLSGQAHEGWPAIEPHAVSDNLTLNHSVFYAALGIHDTRFYVDEHVYQTGNYVWPLYGDDGDASCVECDTGASGVVYEIAGATYESIHLGQGYFRHSNDDLCADGYNGPCEYVL